MTYCVAMSLDAGMIFASDSRTNAGVDHIARFSKMRVFTRDADRVIVMMSSGNLSITQNAINVVEQKARVTDDQTHIWNATSMFDVARMLGDALREVKGRDGPYMEQHNIDASANFILGGQIHGEAPRLFEVYSAELHCSTRRNARSSRSIRRCAPISRSGYQSTCSSTKQAASRSRCSGGSRNSTRISRWSIISGERGCAACSRSCPIPTGSRPLPHGCRFA